MMAAIEAELSTQTNRSSLTIWLVALAVVVFIVWARYAPLDEIVRAEGEVVSAARPQIIQNLEGGMLAELLVAEGDVVEPGQVLARLRDTQFRATVADLEGQLAAGEIRRLRLEAEMTGATDFAIPPDLENINSAFAASERALIVARQADLDSRRSSAEEIVAETRRELETMEDLFAREIAALIELTRARKANSDAEARLNEIVTGAALERATEHSEVLSQTATLREELRLARDQLARTVITSPMRGTVNAVNIGTIGGVVRPGEEMFTIIPDGEQLFVEARVSPADIANVVAGQEATIKLTAYDYTIWGSLSGRVIVVSADTFEDERRADLPPHYRVTLQVNLADRGGRQAGIDIRPGMQSTVELHTGEKTVLQYLTKPLYRGTEALREP
jgi:adhesin transport system membrane fusion protein